jgi:hypothetical protein
MSLVIIDTDCASARGYRRELENGDGQTAPIADAKAAASGCAHRVGGQRV